MDFHTGRKLTDAGLVAVLAGGLRALERLHADECPRLTSACLAPLRDASGCPRLATLSLRGLRSHRRVTLAAVDEVRSVRLGLEIHGSRRRALPVRGALLCVSF